MNTISTNNYLLCDHCGKALDRIELSRKRKIKNARYYECKKCMINFIEGFCKELIQINCDGEKMRFY